MFKDLALLKPFFENPLKDIAVREFGRIQKISPANASKILKGCAKKGILEEKKERTYILYKANVENELYRDLKIFYNMRKIKDSGLLESINQFYLKPTVILFGSAARGEDIEESDFDIIIISEKKKDLPKKEVFEKKINRKIQLFVVKEIKELKNEHLINNVLNGIKIQGGIQ